MKTLLSIAFALAVALTAYHVVIKPSFAKVNAAFEQVNRAR